MVSYLPQKFYKNVILDLLNKFNTLSKKEISDIFLKNWAKHTQDSYILDLVSNGLQLDLKKNPLQQRSGSHHPSAKQTDIVALKIKKLLSKESHCW